MPAGRPTDYDPKYHCEEVVKLMSNGYTRLSVCREFEICEKTLYTWMEKHPDFLQSVQKGDTMYRGWLEDQARGNMANPNFNATLWSMKMRRFNNMAAQRTVKLDGVSKDNPPIQNAYAVLLAVANGSITPDEASKLTGLIQSMINIEASTSLLDRISALESEQ